MIYCIKYLKNCSDIRHQDIGYPISETYVVLRGGLEPPHLTAYAPQTYVSTSSTT